jgi:hypothetical protein
LRTHRGGDTADSVTRITFSVLESGSNGKPAMAED